MLLERIVASPVPARRPARRRAVPAPLALAGVAGLPLAAGVVLALPGGAPTDAFAAAYAAVSRPGTILHYREHWVAPGSRVSPHQDLDHVEVWQASDGSRGRALTRIPAHSIDRDSHLPVRVEQPPCREAPAGQKGLTMDEVPGFTVDFLSFEVLPADAANEHLLDMSPHPGAKVVDGAAIDAAEARHDKARARHHEVPQPSPTAVR